MEWVIAALAVGCLFFAFQIVMDYIKYKAVIAPRIRQLEAAKEELRARIEATRGELDERRGKLDPIRGEIERLEQEYLELQRQIQETKQKPRPPHVGKGATGFRP